MNKIDFEKVLDEALTRLENGEDLEHILEGYKNQRDRLEPLLRAAQAQIGIPSPEFTAQALVNGRNQLLAEVDRLSEEGHFSRNRTKTGIFRYPERWFQFIGRLIFRRESIDMKLAPRLALYVIVTVLIAGFFTVNASASSLPGDGLYTVKRGWEQTRLLFTVNDQSKSALKAQFEQERVEEVESLISSGRMEDVEFTGTLDSMEDVWVVGGISVIVDGNTEIQGTTNPGDLVKVEALTQEDGTLLALEITLLEQGQDLAPEDSSLEDVSSDEDSDQAAEETEISDDSSSSEEMDDSSVDDMDAEDDLNDSSAESSSSSAGEEIEADSDSGSETKSDEGSDSPTVSQESPEEGEED